MPSAAFFPSPFDYSVREFLPVESGLTVAEWLDKSGMASRMQEQAIVVALDAQELPESEWCSVIGERSIITLHALPQGPVVVAWIVANWVVVAYMVVTALYLANMKEPGMPETADSQEASPTYSIASRQNSARVGSPKPVFYGRVRTWPDLGALPFTEFEADGDQVLYQLFEVRQGRCVIDESDMRFEDTPLSNFNDYQVEIIPPGETSELFPSAVVSSGEFAQIEFTNEALPSFVVSDVGQDVVRISVDVVAANGIYEQSRRTGELNNYTVRYRFERRAIDDSGNPMGGWVTMGVHAISGSNRDAIRRTHAYDVQAGRYEVRPVLVSMKSDSVYVSDRFSWAGLRGSLQDKLPATTTTRVALKIRASEQLSGRGASQFNLISMGLLPIWDPDGGWSDPEITANPAWVFADIARNSIYGGSRSDAYINLPGLYALAQQFASEGIEFNGGFDTEGTVWDALTRVAAVARCVPVDRAGVYHMVRDSFNPIPSAMFSMRNIVRDSFRLQYVGVLEETVDSVRVLFFDKDQGYRQVPMLCALPGSPGVKPREVVLFGVVDQEQAFKWGMYLAAVNFYRRVQVQWETGIEGYLPFMYDVVAVSHYLIGREGQRQVSGDVVAWDGQDLLTLGERITGLTEPYIVLRGLDGAPSAPYPVQVVDDRRVRIQGSFDSSVLRFDPGYERPHFMCGEGADFYAQVKVTKIEPQGGGRYRISGFIDAPEVYTAAEGLDPPPIDVLPTPQQFAPVVTNLVAELGGTVDDPAVMLSWAGSNADYYLVELSLDGAESWSQVGVGKFLTEWVVHNPPADTVVQYRVAGVNLLRGAWVSTSINTAQVGFLPPPAITNLQLREAFLGPVLRLQWDSLVETHRLVFSVGDQDRYIVTTSGTQFDLTAEIAQWHSLGRAFTVRVYALAPSGQSSITAPSLAVSNPAPAQLNNLQVQGLLGQVMITFDWPADPDLVGISVWMSDSSGFTPGPTNRVIDRSMNPVLGVPVPENQTVYLRVAAVDAWGDDVNYSGQYTATGGGVDLAEIEQELEDLAYELALAEMALEDLEGKFPIGSVDISDDAITAPKLAANAVIAEKIAALAITTEKLSALAVNADKLAANAVTAEKIAALAVTAGKIAANAVTATEINVGALSAIAANLGTVTAGLLRTTTGTDARLEIDSAGSFPLWMGQGAKNANNGEVYYDRVNRRFVIREPVVNGRRFEFEPSHSLPFWYGTGTKTAANGQMYFDSATQRLMLRNFQVINGLVTELQSANWVDGEEGWRLYPDGSAQFNNILIRRPNIVAQGELSIPMPGNQGQAHFGFALPGPGDVSPVWLSRMNPGFVNFGSNTLGFPGPGHGPGGYWEFYVNIPRSSYAPDAVHTVNGRMLTAQALVTNSYYWWTGPTPTMPPYGIPCQATVERVAEYGAEEGGSYIRLALRVQMPTDIHPNIRNIHVLAIKWALCEFT